MEEKRSAREETRRLKRTIIIVLIGMLLFMVAYLVISAVLSAAKEGKEEETTDRYTVIFSNPIENIMDDPEYLALNRTVWYYDTPVDGEGAVLDDQTKADYGEPVAILYDYLASIVAGDAETYNAFFSSYYFAKEGNEEVSFFYPQQLYGNGGIQIRLMENATVKTDKNGKSYTQYDYTVTFMIHKNNGSFTQKGQTYLHNLDRDAEVTLYYVITDISGSYKIDNVLKYRH